MMFLGLLINLFTSIVLPILEGIVGIICQLAFWLFECTIKLVYRLFMWLVDSVCELLNRAPKVAVVAIKETVKPIMEPDVAIPGSTSVMETPPIIGRQDSPNFKEPPEHIN